MSIHRKLAILLTSLVMILPLSALEEREFHNTDRSKSFRATLADYDEAKGLVTVQLATGKTKRFAMKLLSEEDQKYIKANSEMLVVARAFDVKFKEVKGETTRTKAGLIRTRKTPTSYQVQLYNRSKKIVEDVDVRYSYYYCVGSSSATGPRHTPKVKKGVLGFPKMFGQYSESRETAQVDLIRESKKGVAPPVPSGGGGG
ncbi:MAG: hypothetical protein AB8F34_12755 [Akkermansiaceae bacterium]